MGGEDDAIVAEGAETLLGVLQEWAGLGYTGQVSVATDADRSGVRCEACGTVVGAGELCVERTRRLEGASDAADMMLLVAAVCPSCGSGGVLTLAYGPRASAGETGVLRDLHIDDSSAAPVGAPVNRRDDVP